MGGFHFLPDSATLAAYAFTCVVLFVTPGPDMSLQLARTLAHGRASGMASMAGAMLGCVVHSVLAALGISALVAASPVAFLTLKIVGAGYLLWLAIDAIRHGSGLTVSAVEPEVPRLWRTFLLGLTVNLSNPKIVLFFVTFLPQFIASDDAHAGAKILFLGLMFVAISVPLAILMIMAAGRLVDWLKARPQVVRAIDWLFAGVFGAFAVKIIATQSR